MHDLLISANSQSYGRWVDECLFSTSSIITGHETHNAGAHACNVNSAKKTLDWTE